MCSERSRSIGVSLLWSDPDEDFRGKRHEEKCTEEKPCLVSSSPFYSNPD